MSSIASNDSRLRLFPWAGNELPPEYAIPEHAPSQADAQEYCRRLARSHYENFSVATWFLPERLRQHFFNIYAYCRISDDLGDEVGDPQASLSMLDQWQAELDACYVEANELAITATSLQRATRQETERCRSQHRRTVVPPSW